MWERARESEWKEKGKENQREGETLASWLSCSSSSQQTTAVWLCQSPEGLEMGTCLQDPRKIPHVKLFS